MKEKMKILQDNLAGMRVRFEELRVKGNLGKMELRDKLEELRDAFDPAYTKAKKAIAELSDSGREESHTLAKSLRAGWDELRRTHKELSESADRQRTEEHDAKRKGDG